MTTMPSDELGSGRPSPEEAADALYIARSTKNPISAFTDGSSDLDASWGYAVQESDRMRREEAGETVIGAKLGLTSEAKQAWA